MKYIFQNTGTVLAAAIFFMVLGIYSWPSNSSETVLYLIYDDSRAGEKNQVLGVANSLKKNLPANTLQIEYDLKKKNDFLTDIRSKIRPNSKNRGIVIAAEVESINVLKELGPQENLVISHSSHQYTKDHANLKNIADIVALPRYVVTPEILLTIESPTTVLVQTVGVPHNLSQESIKEAYQKSKDNLPSAQNYVGVILGGDADTPDKRVLYYKPEEAINLATYLVPIVKEKKAHLLILNGPRTGKHDPLTGKIIEGSHRDGRVDAVTQAFIESLDKQGFKSGQDYTLLDFQFGKPSMYPVVLGALDATHGSLYVAGESTSMVSESADCLPGHVIAFTNGAMNENHKKHCLSEQDAGRIAILENQDKQWKLMSASGKETKLNKSASQEIADAIAKRLREKSA